MPLFSLFTPGECLIEMKMSCQRQSSVIMTSSLAFFFCPSFSADFLQKNADHRKSLPMQVASISAARKNLLIPTIGRKFQFSSG